MMISFESFLKDLIRESYYREYIVLNEDEFKIAIKVIHERLESTILFAKRQYWTIYKVKAEQPLTVLKVCIFRKLLEVGCSVQAIFNLVTRTINEPFEKEKNHEHYLKFIGDLITMGGNVNSMQNKSSYPIYKARCKLNSKLIKVFIDHGASYSDIAKEYFIGIFHLQNAEGLEMLVNRGFNLNNNVIKSGQGNTLLFYLNHLDIVKYLVECAGIDVNGKNVWGDTALVGYIQRGKIEIIRYLLEHNADVNSINNDGDTLLMIAAKIQFCRYHLEIIRLLISYGAKLDVRNPKTGMTAFLYACSKAYPDTMEVLLRDLADINDANKQGKSSLMFACGGNKIGSFMTANWLLKHGADVNFRNKEGKTVFGYKLLPEVRQLLEEAKAFQLPQEKQNAKKRTHSQMSADK